MLTAAVIIATVMLIFSEQARYKVIQEGKEKDRNIRNLQQQIVGLRKQVELLKGEEG